MHVVNTFFRDKFRKISLAILRYPWYYAFTLLMAVHELLGEKVRIFLEGRLHRLLAVVFFVFDFKHKFAKLLAKILLCDIMLGKGA